MSKARLLLGDAIEQMKALPDSSVALIAVDPPYFKVKGEAWDRQWEDAAAFLAWMGELCREWQRVLKANGSLYVFASPAMRSRVEVEVSRWFSCLPTITWRKDSGWAKHQCKEEMRAWFPSTEAIIFAEHFGADNIAKGEAGYEAKCDELRGFVFEPLRAYLDGERERSGVSVRQVAEAFQQRTGSRTVTGGAGHWFGRVQWSLPTEENYLWLRRTLASMDHDGQYLRREYEYLRREYEDLRREYKDLRREYEDLRRPFSVTADVPYTDVWDFPTVNHYPGKHVCEKPLVMLEHIVKASSRPGDMVLDCFLGSGTTGVAALNLGREFIGIEKDEGYFQQARKRIEACGEIGVEICQPEKKEEALCPVLYPLFAALEAS